ncbi:MAG TPA: SagB family peptide dehydrogenase [Trebonia sp.]|jgi:SagB-type dehydrogenase family enzyme|nr:SagB family peptide dehydrogenase [Trebonia sp.]
MEGESYKNSGHRQQLFDVLERLQPLIIRSLKLTTGQPLLSVIPLTPRSGFRPAVLSADAPVRLSAFAGLRTNGREYRLESPLALHRVLLHRAEAIQLIGKLGSPTAPGEVTTVLPSAQPIAQAALEYLVAAGMASQAEAPVAGGKPVFSEDRDLALAGWSPDDLAFHASSTLGRHDHSCGATYPMDYAGVTWSGEPVVKPLGPRPAITLHRPRWDDLCLTDPPLTVAVEGRRSVRDHSGEPVTVTEIGDLLYRTCRVRRRSDRQEAGTVAPRVVAVRELSDRPYPGGGACYELESYVTVGRCAGLSKGVYHYDPLGHLLEPVSSDPGIVDEVLRFAGSGANMTDQPQVLITLTARIRRLSWKYEGLPYRLALIDAGVLIQDLYLVCTAMRIAPCAIGCVSSDLAERAFGTDWRTEPSIVQFIVGRAGTEAGHPGTWHAANDGDWADHARSALSIGRASPSGD